MVGLRGLPDVMGGVETHCEQLLPRLRARVPQLRILVVARKGYVADRPTHYKGVAVLPIWCWRTKYFEAISHTLWATARSVVGWRPDLVHLHGIGAALFAPFYRMAGISVVVTHHGEDYQRAKWNGLARLVLRIGEQSALRWANHVIFVSKSVMANKIELGMAEPERCTYIPNGFPAACEQAETDVLGPLGLEPGGYVLAVGRLVPEKGFQDLIAAFLRHGDPGRKLVIVGDADFSDRFSQDLKARSSANVIFAGRHDRRSLQCLYEQAGLFVLPSHHEGLPISALEAIGFGAPVLLSDIAVNKDIGLPPANYFPVGDVGALATKLGRPVDEFRVDRDVALRDFDWDEIAQSTAEVYRAALDLPPPPGRELPVAPQCLPRRAAERR